VETARTRCAVHTAPTALHHPFEVQDPNISSPNADITSVSINSRGQRVTARLVVTYGVTSHHEYDLQRSVFKDARTSTLLTLLHDEDSKDKVMEYQLGVPAACVAIFVYALLKRRRRVSVIRDVPGPGNPSWIFGVFLER